MPVKRRLSCNQRRAAILQAAVNLFAEKGFRGTTTRELAAAAGVTEPVLYAHFSTKRDLYSGILETMCTGEVENLLNDVLEPFLRAENDAQLFREVGGLILDWYAEEPARVRLLAYGGLEHHELAEEYYRQHAVPFLKVLSEYLAKRISKGAFTNVDPVLAVRLFAGMIQHFGLASTIFRPHDQHPPRETIVETAVTIFLDGIRKKGREDLALPRGKARRSPENSKS
jgi:AcrR family transcriptional regulator